MADASVSLHKAIYVALTELIDVPVYDAVAENAEMPYVTIDSQHVAQQDYINAEHEERMIYLSVWSQYQGQKEVFEILGQMKVALHRIQLLLDVGKTTRLSVQKIHSIRDLDGVTFIGKMTLQCFTDY